MKMLQVKDTKGYVHAVWPDTLHVLDRGGSVHLLHSATGNHICEVDVEFDEAVSAIEGLQTRMLDDATSQAVKQPEAEEMQVHCKFCTKLVSIDDTIGGLCESCYMAGREV